MSTSAASIRETAKAQASCPFCKRIEAGEYDYEDDYSVAFQPLNPVTPGHFLAVPQVHVTSALWAPEAAGHVMRFAADLADKMDLDACNFITSAGTAATQTVMHLHIHVVPRRPGDGLLLPWTFQKHGGTATVRSMAADAIAYRNDAARKAGRRSPPRGKRDLDLAASYAALLDELGGAG